MASQIFGQTRKMSKSKSTKGAIWHSHRILCGSEVNSPTGTHKDDVAAQSTNQVDPQVGDMTTPQVDKWAV